MDGARFSACGTYRYALWRSWLGGEGELLFIMLNPSTADESANDPTIERCVRRTKGLGFSGLRVVNLFALRSTDPRALAKHPDPVGPENDDAIFEAAHEAGAVICAWGSGGKLRGRAEAVKKMLTGTGVGLSYLRLNCDGEPGHPLYIPYEQPLRQWALPVPAGEEPKP